MRLGANRKLGFLRERNKFNYKGKKGKHGTLFYMYCIVTEIHPSKDNLVRTVSVRYLNLPSKKGKIIKIDVCRLTLIYSSQDAINQPAHNKVF